MSKIYYQVILHAADNSQGLGYIDNIADALKLAERCRQFGLINNLYTVSCTEYREESSAFDSDGCPIATQYKLREIGF